MAKMTFRLQPLLRIRQMEEDEAKRIVADRLRRIRRVQHEIERLQKDLVDASAELRTLVLAGPIVPLEATRQRGYIGRLRYRLLQAEAQLRTEQAKLAAERAALAEASKRRKMLAKLKERQLRRWTEAENRRERREADEIGVIRFAYERVGGKADPVG